MREIKFRFKYSNGANCFLKTFTLAEIMNGEPFEVLSDQPLLKSYKMCEDEEQFTGLKDKNGKEIYEGDIFYKDDEDYKNWEVEYSQGGFGLVALENRECDCSLWFYSSLGEVIGNIHENPELIKEP